MKLGKTKPNTHVSTWFQMTRPKMSKFYTLNTPTRAIHLEKKKKNCPKHHKSWVTFKHCSQHTHACTAPPKLANWQGLGEAVCNHGICAAILKHDFLARDPLSGKMMNEINVLGPD